MSDLKGPAWRFAAIASVGITHAVEVLVFLFGNYLIGCYLAAKTARNGRGRPFAKRQGRCKGAQACPSITEEQDVGVEQKHSVKARRLAGQLARRQVEIDAAERCKPAADALIEIDLGPLRFLQRLLQNFPHFGFHRMPVLGGADAQPLFQRRI